MHSTTFLGCFNIGRALTQLHKNYETFYRLNPRWLVPSPSILKKAIVLQNIHLGQSEVSVLR